MIFVVITWFWKETKKNLEFVENASHISDRCDDVNFIFKTIILVVQPSVDLHSAYVS